MKTDANKKQLVVGDKVHVIGRADKVLYIAELNEKTAGVSHERGGKASFDVRYDRLVKFKNQE